jgi:hypothetical protein
MEVCHETIRENDVRNRTFVHRCPGLGAGQLLFPTVAYHFPADGASFPKIIPSHTLRQHHLPKRQPLYLARQSHEQTVTLLKPTVIGNIPTDGAFIQTVIGSCSKRQGHCRADIAYNQNVAEYFPTEILFKPSVRLLCCPIFCEIPIHGHHNPACSKSSSSFFQISKSIF